MKVSDILRVKGNTLFTTTPDRLLARQVTAALDRWRINPDDSAGRPLDLRPIFSRGQPETAPRPKPSTLASRARQSPPRVR